MVDILAAFAEPAACPAHLVPASILNRSLLVDPSVHVVEITSLPARRAPITDGPTVRALPIGSGDTDLTSDTGSSGGEASSHGGAAVLQVCLPAGAGMPEHDHGPSAVTLIPVSGRVQLGHRGDRRMLGPGTVAFIDIGERVSLRNPDPDEATLLAVVAPPDFAEAVSSWPTSATPASEPAITARGSS